MGNKRQFKSDRTKSKDSRDIKKQTTGVPAPVSIEQLKLQKTDAELKGENIAELKGENIAEKKDGNIAEKKDGNIAEKKDGNIAELKDGNIAELKDKNIAELKDGNIAELKDKNIAELKDGNIAELKDKNIAELKDGNIAELKDKNIAVPHPKTVVNHGVYLDYSSMKLPESYDENILTLIPRDPNTIFAYWDFKQPASKEITENKFLRIYKSYDNSFSATTLHSEIPIYSGMRSHYIKTDKACQFYKAVIYSESFGVTASAVVKMPFAPITFNKWRIAESIGKRSRTFGLKNDLKLNLNLNINTGIDIKMPAKTAQIILSQSKTNQNAFAFSDCSQHLADTGKAQSDANIETPEYESTQSIIFNSKKASITAQTTFADKIDTVFSYKEHITAAPRHSHFDILASVNAAEMSGLIPLRFYKCLPKKRIECCSSSGRSCAK